jgi:hypothetical protein
VFNYFQPGDVPANTGIADAAQQQLNEQCSGRSGLALVRCECVQDRVNSFKKFWKYLYDGIPDNVQVDRHLAVNQAIAHA